MCQVLMHRLNILRFGLARIVWLFKTEKKHVFERREKYDGISTFITVYLPNGHIR